MEQAAVKSEYRHFTQKNGPRVENFANEENFVGLLEDVVDFGFGEVADFATHVKTCRPLESQLSFCEEWVRNGCGLQTMRRIE